MVAALAWGFLGQSIFQHVRGTNPNELGELLFGRFSGISIAQSAATIAVSVAVVLTLAMLSKEVLYYCIDPQGAQTSGVPAAS